MSEPVRVNPENHFTRAFHDGCGGIMAWLTRNMKSLEAENGDQLHLWECMTCGALVLAGLAKDRRIVHRQLVRPEPATARELRELQAAARIARLRLADAARAVRSLPQDALGRADDQHSEWPIRDELLSTIEAAGARLAALLPPPEEPAP